MVYCQCRIFIWLSQIPQYCCLFHSTAPEVYVTGLLGVTELDSLPPTPDCLVSLCTPGSHSPWLVSYICALWFPNRPYCYHVRWSREYLRCCFHATCICALALWLLSHVLFRSLHLALLFWCRKCKKNYYVFLCLSPIIRQRGNDIITVYNKLLYCVYSKSMWRKLLGEEVVASSPGSGPQTGTDLERALWLSCFHKMSAVSGLTEHCEPPVKLNISWCLRSSRCFHEVFGLHVSSSLSFRNSLHSEWAHSGCCIP